MKHPQISTRVLLTSVVAVLAAVGAALGFALWSTANIDTLARERQTEMVSQALSTKRAQVGLDQQSVAIWDDTVRATRAGLNQAWADINLNAWMYDYFGHQRLVVLNSRGQPIDVMENGKSVPVANYAQLAAAIEPLANQVRNTIAAGGMTDFNHQRASVPPSALDFVVIDGMPAVVGVMPIVSDTRALVQEPGTEPMLASIFFLDQAFADQLGRQYLFDNVGFSLTPSRDPDKMAYPLLNSAGRFVAFFEWTGHQPGQILLRQAGPLFAAVFGIGALLVLLLLRQVQRSAAALEAGRLRAEHQAAHDQLTGLPNRLSFDAQLAQLLAGRQGTGTHLSLLLLDLDRFKQINDTLGHQAGDELLRAVGTRLRETLGPDVPIARFGGDEFGIVVQSRERPPDAMAVSTTIIDAIAQAFELNQVQAFVGVSIGIVNAASGALEPGELVRKADIALHEAKSAGRNQAVIYEERMNEQVQLQHMIEGELREALRRDDQLSVVFQPLVDQRSGNVTGAEALARWQHPKFGQVPPARFISIAESTGLIEAVGEFILRRGCELGAKSPGRNIAVNISPTQLRNPKFTELVFDILQQTGMGASDLELEITESILLDDAHVAAQNLRTLRAAGIHIALDDFGTGYSSLSYLKRYPVDRIKIDRSFVNQLAPGHVSVAIIQAIVTLAHAMDLQVTAEGVETAEQAEMLGNMGCNTLQGYLFSAAVSPEKIEAIFADAAKLPANKRRTGT